MSATEIRVGGMFKLTKKIGSGSFGEIYLGVNINTSEEVAVKLEPIKARHPQLLYESKILKHLVGDGIPEVLWYGMEGDYNVLVMQLLGPSLEDLFTYCERKYSLKTTIMISRQMFGLIEYVHKHNLIHRDIKPDNFLSGPSKDSARIYIIDFGLGKRYKDPKTGQHLVYRNNKNLTGTARYASLNAHMGIEQSRRDDLESVTYVMAYFLRGNLPWQGLQAKTKAEKYRRIMETKMATTPETLCKGLPIELAEIVRYCKSLSFTEDPNYEYIQKLMRELFQKSGFTLDYQYDWAKPKFVDKKIDRRNPYLQKNNHKPHDNQNPSKSAELAQIRKGNSMGEEKKKEEKRKSEDLIGREQNEDIEQNLSCIVLGSHGEDSLNSPTKNANSSPKQIKEYYLTLNEYREKRKNKPKKKSKDKSHKSKPKCCIF